MKCKLAFKFMIIFVENQSEIAGVLSLTLHFAIFEA